MKTCLEKSCLFGLYCASFPFGYAARVWELIVLVPDHCLSFYFFSSMVKGSCKHSFCLA